ncbi:hypothetical protein EHS13_13555 [Paenibacillus psychroresistens]|uniref:Uncharacterized protein n=1 Tax=Paenibacillus psychroresistens TaxID=1778678 RepID=A0A6B8RIC7_9BACL|nr:hypothetical protein [Paenibacillus psychroresistens]QGQ95829.1 hypothetical protein EHS13_13555 [Paenibacillus psychroresistens]
MSSVEQVEVIEQVDDLDARILETSRKQLIEENKIIMNEDGSFTLTEKGKEIVQKELQRYESRPNMAILIQMYILQMYDVSVY